MAPAPLCFKTWGGGRGGGIAYKDPPPCHMPGSVKLLCIILGETL